MKNCPFCDESIQDSAIKCRYCGEFLSTNKDLSDLSTDKIAASSQKDNNSVGIKTQLSEFLLFQRIKAKCIDCKHEGMSGISDIKHQQWIFGFGCIIFIPFVKFGGLIGCLIGIGFIYLLSKFFNKSFQKLGMTFICSKCKSKNIVKIK